MNEYKTHFTVLKLAAALIIIAITVIILKTLAGIFIPLVLAIFFAYLFAPPVEFLAKFKIPRIITLFILLGIISFIGIIFAQIIINNMREFIRAWPTMEKKFLENRLILNIGSFFRNYLNIELKNLSDLFGEINISEFLSSAFNVSFSIAGKLILGILMLVFIYLTYQNYPNLIRKAFDEKKANHIFEILKNINEQIIKYIVIKTVISAGTGLFTFAACSLFGVRFAALWGFIAFLFNYIPYIGSIFAVIFPIALSIIQFPQSYLPLLIALILIAIQLFLGSFLDPEVMGSRFNLSPILILIALFFWGNVWGIVGAFLAVPITAIMKIVIQNIDSIRFIGILMSKRVDSKM